MVVGWGRMCRSQTRLVIKFAAANFSSYNSTSLKQRSLKKKMAHPIHEANESSPYGNLTKQEFYEKHQISHHESFMLNNQNMKIFTQSWQPADSNIRLKGLIGMIHGYTSESSWLFELNTVALAKAGFFVCALDLQGHGSSEGPPDHITDIHPLVDDCIQFFDSARALHPKLPHFLYGESLGGAIAILVCLKQRSAWKGLVLSGAMCEITRKVKLWPLDKLINAAAFIAPSWRIGITTPLARIAYREKWKSKLVERSPNRRTSGKVTAGSAMQFFRVCDYIKKNCAELEVPMLILHGEDDAICDAEGARYLYKSATRNKDKTLKIFPGMWHLSIGEPNERVEKIFNIVLTWIGVRADLIGSTT